MVATFGKIKIPSRYNRFTKSGFRSHKSHFRSGSDNGSSSSSYSSSLSSSRSDGFDEEDNSSHDEILSGLAIKNNICRNSRFVLNATSPVAGTNDGTIEPNLRANSHQSVETLSSNGAEQNRPLSPWKKSRSRNRIIEDLKDVQSSIHRNVVDWEKEENIDKLWKEYAPQYQRSRFKQYMKTIMKNYAERKGPFNAASSEKPTSQGRWEDSASKKRIIKELTDHRSPIHQLVTDWEKEENLDALWKEYAHGYQRSQFKSYMQTIMKNFRAKKGDFKDTWYATKDGNHSKGYSLLRQLMLNNEIGEVSTSFAFTPLS